MRVPAEEIAYVPIAQAPRMQIKLAVLTRGDAAADGVTVELLTPTDFSRPLARVVLDSAPARKLSASPQRFVDVAATVVADSRSPDTPEDESLSKNIRSPAREARET